MLDYINKFYMMKEFGWAETWRSFDSISNYDYEIIIACSNAYVKKQELDASKAQFYNAEAIAQG